MKRIIITISAIMLCMSMQSVWADEVRTVLLEEYFTSDVAMFTPSAAPDEVVKEAYPNWSFSLPSTTDVTPPQFGNVWASGGYLNLKKTSAKADPANYGEAIRAQRSLLSNAKGRYVLEFTVKYPTNSTEGLGFQVLGNDGNTVLIDGLVNNSRKIIEVTDGSTRQTNDSVPYAMPTCGAFNIDTTVTLDIDLDNRSFRFYTNRIDNGTTAVLGINGAIDRQFKNSSESVLGLTAIRFFPRNTLLANAIWQIKSIKLFKVEQNIQFSVLGFYHDAVAEENRIKTLEAGTEYNSIICLGQAKNANDRAVNVQPIAALYQGGKLIGVSASAPYHIPLGETADISIQINNVTFVDRNSHLKLFVWDGFGTITPLASKKDRVLGLEINDLATLRKRLQSDLYASSANPSGYLTVLDQSGKFTDIDYTLDSKALGFGPTNALDRIKVMVKAYASEGNVWYHNQGLWEKINLTLTDWAKNDYKSSANWWYNEISVPSKIAEILLFDLPEMNYRSTLIDIAKRGFPNVNAGLVHGSSDTGANLTDKILVALNIAVGAEDEDAVLKYVTGLLEGELKFFYAPNEGMMHDYSFQQHRALLYSGSYGVVFESGVNKILKTITETKFDVSKRARNLYADFILDGQQWMYRFGRNDLNVMGRAISRKGGVGSGLMNHSLTAAKILLLQEDIDRKEELSAYLTNRPSAVSDYLSGIKHFWISDYTTFHRPGFFVGIRGSSTRTYNTEYMNSENSKGYFLADGVTTIMRTGKEYEEIFPVWDWNKLPGTTTKVVTTIPKPATEKGSTEFVGGVTDGTYGVTVLDYSHNSTTAKKAWFCFDQGFTALGSGISTTVSGNVFTNLNQCLLSGKVMFHNGSGVQALASGSIGIKNGVNWVWHDKVGYYFPQSTDAYIENTSKTGKWSDINTGQSSETITKNVFNLYVSHGNMPSGGTYAYTVLPDMDEAQLQGYVTNPDMLIVSNTTAQQAVWSKSAQTLGIAFWSAGVVTASEEISGVANGITVSVDNPCLVLARKLPNNRWSISVSNPKNKVITVTVRINQLFYGDGVMQDNGESVVTFALPSDAMAGSTVTKILTE